MSGNRSLYTGTLFYMPEVLHNSNLNVPMLTAFALTAETFLHAILIPWEFFAKCHMRWLHSCYFFNLCWWHIGFSGEFSRKFSICTMDGFCKSKTSNIASPPRRLSGPLRVVELGGPMNDKVGACAHEWNWHSNHPRIIRHANRKFAIKVIPYACPTYTTWWTHSLAGGRIGPLPKVQITPFCSQFKIK